MLENAAKTTGDKMHWTTDIDSKIKELELRKQPVIIRVNKFDEDSALKFSQEIAMAHNRIDA